MKSETRLVFIEESLTSVLEKLKALGAQRAQLLEGAKKEALDNAEKAGLLTSSNARGLPCRKRRDPSAS